MDNQTNRFTDRKNILEKFTTFPKYIYKAGIPDKNYRLARRQREMYYMYYDIFYTKLS